MSWVLKDGHELAGLPVKVKITWYRVSDREREMEIVNVDHSF